MTLKLFPHLFGACFALVAMAGCDEGDIYQTTSTLFTTGKTIVVEAPVTGLDSWQSLASPTCHPALAGFSADGQYAEVSSNIVYSSSTTRFLLTGVDDNVAEIRFCVLDALRKEIHSFVTLSVDDGVIDGDTIRFSYQTGVNMSIFDAVSERVFNTTCLACHGGAGHAASGLDLSHNNALANLVGVKANKCSEDSDTLRIVARHPEKSLLYLILNSRLSETWAYDHSVEVVDATVLNMLRDWILSMPEE